MSKNKAAIARAKQEREALARRQKDEREAKRVRRVAESNHNTKVSDASATRADGPHGLTFGEFVKRAGLLEKISRVTGDIIHETVAGGEEFARKSLKVISCHNCTAPKGCCKISTTAYLYEVMPLAARLIRDGRDTPELRAQLQSRAEAMEDTPKQLYDLPCVFLDERERCSVYEHRPSECGAHLVFSDPALCSSDDPGVRTEVVDSPYRRQYPPQFERRFAIDVGLHGTGVPYVGALPRMVLLCLEAWDRSDYIEFLAEQCRLATLRFLRAIAGPELSALGLALPAT
jgi:Fe-S-cluster containining protein